MRNLDRIIIGFVLLASGACHKRSQIDAGHDPVPRASQPGTTEIPKSASPVVSKDWKDGSPQLLVGNWASSLFQDQRCTAFYSFIEGATAELNLICLNAEKKQFEREYRRYRVAQYPGIQQVRFKPLDSSCPAGDSRSIKEEGVSFLYAVESMAAGNQPLKLALWEPDVNKTPLNLSKSDGLMVEGFPGKTGTYLGMPVVSGCFTDGLVMNFKTNTMP